MERCNQRWKADYHMHTVYCDGNDTPVEMIEAAIEKKMDAIGFSGHSYVDFDREWCMSPEGTKEYVREIRKRKEEYKGRIQVLLGLEQDYYSDIDRADFDYIIGSVHYIRKDGNYLTVDLGKDAVLKDVQTYYHGDIYAYLEDYFRLAGDVVRRTKCDIVGHFDLVMKFNQDNTMFDKEHPRYVKAYREAVDRILESDVLFEINMGAMIRGYRNAPYPDLKIMEYIRDGKGRFIFNSDSHQKDSLMYGFSEWKGYLREKGFVILDRLDG